MYSRKNLSTPQYVKWRKRGTWCSPRLLLVVGVGFGGQGSLQLPHCVLPRESGSFLRPSIRWNIAIIGCLYIIRGPEYRITALILSLMSGLKQWTGHLVQVVLLSWKGHFSRRLRAYLRSDMHSGHNSSEIWCLLQYRAIITATVLLSRSIRRLFFLTAKRLYDSACKKVKSIVWYHAHNILGSGDWIRRDDWWEG